MFETGFDIPDPSQEMCFPPAKMMKLAHRLVSYGMDQELDACCEWLSRHRKPIIASDLRFVRRSVPSLKQQALEAFDRFGTEDNGIVGDMRDGSIIRIALEALPEDIPSVKGG
jgi:hypothetical protein